MVAYRAGGAHPHLAAGAAMNRAEIFDAIHVERGRQADKWHGEHPWGFGDCSSPDVPAIVKAAVLSEEAGEVSRAVLDGDENQLRTELIQCAAICVAWLELFD